jgi:hypothetical protein
VDIVLGVSMAPTKVRMVLVQGENADGVCVDQDDFDVAAGPPSTAPAQVLSALLATRESAAEGGYQLLSSGVTWTDPIQAGALRDALAAHKIENVILVSAFMAAAALAQAVGDATGYARTALLFVEPYTATLAVVNTGDGAVIDVHRKVLPDDDGQAIAKLVELVSGTHSLDTHPEGVFVVGSGVDIPLIKPVLEAATPLVLSVPEEPEMALARGAALASSNAPLFASSTAARAYALDGGTDDRPEYRPYLVAAEQTGIDNVAYSAVSDDPADDAVGAELSENAPRRRPVLLIGSSLAVVAISAVVALEIALAISMRPTVALRPSPNENIIVPTAPAPAPVIVREPEVVRLPTPVAAPRPVAPRIEAPPPVARPPVPVPVAPPPVLIPLAPRAPAPPPRLVPRAPLLQPRSSFPEPQIPRQRGLLPRLGGGRGVFRGPFGGPFGGFGRR